VIMDLLPRPAIKKWLDVAKEVAKGSTCLRPEAQIGSIAVRDGKLLASGMNGVFGKKPACSTRGYCIRTKNNIESGTRREVAFCICAEQRMICEAARNDIHLENADVIVTHLPCAICVRMMIETGIKRVYYEVDYPNQFSRDIAEMAGFELVNIKKNYNL